jgi:hypothetical protein
MWESNPPKRLLTPRTGFEDQRAHQHPSIPLSSALNVFSITFIVLPFNNAVILDGVKLLWSFCLTTLPMLCNQTPLPTIRPDQDLCCSIDRRIVLFFFEYTPVPTTMNCIL